MIANAQAQLKEVKKEVAKEMVNEKKEGSELTMTGDE